MEVVYGSKRSKQKNADGWLLTPQSYLTIEEILELRECAYRRAKSHRWGKRSRVLEWIVLEIALGTGLRVFEITQLKWSDIAYTNDGGYLVVQRGKGGKRRIAYFNDNLARYLRRYHVWLKCNGHDVDRTTPLFLSTTTHKPLTSRALQKMFDRLKTASGISGHTFHHLRHTHATYLLKASGNSLPVVKKQMGHSSIRTTQTYLHVLENETAKAVNKLYQ